MDVSKKILVVENDEVVVVLISHILTRQSYAVRTSSGIAEAERLIESEPWDAILLDLKFPDGSGAELIRKVQESRPDLLRRIIIVTGAIPEAQKLADLPLWAVVRKPFEVAVLVEAVRSCISENGRE